MTLDSGRSPFHLVQRLEILLVQMEAIKADRESVNVLIIELNNKIKKISAKIDHMEKVGENYLCTEDIKRQRCSTQEIIQLLKNEKQELFIQRNFLDQDMDATNWRLNDIEVDYSKLIEREKQLYLMTDHIL